ncbi:glycosyltransferase [Opitutaceae bacterium TAV1]|nr:glycosyltransferase [Opitutaceae bacterium TAV1]
MRIAIVTETFPPEINGIAVTFDRIATELGRRGHSVVVYRPARDDLPAASAHPDYAEAIMPGMPLPGRADLRIGWPAGAMFRRWWHGGGPDVVHVATPGPLGASAIGAARALGIPVTSSFHARFHHCALHRRFGVLAKLSRRLVLAWLRRTHNRTVRTFVSTEEVRAELARLGFRNLGILSRGVDTRLFDPGRRCETLRKSWGAGPDDPVAICAGRLVAGRNQEGLAAAWLAMQQANPRCRFVIVGDGPMRAAFERGYPGFVFTGYLSREELARHFASADIYLHATLGETFGNVVIEAMASGLAVAGFDYAAARKYVSTGKNGIIVPYGAGAALADAGVWLATDARLRRQLGRAARATMEEHSWDAVIGRFESDLHAAAGMPLRDAGRRHGSPVLFPPVRVAGMAGAQRVPQPASRLRPGPRNLF